MKQSYRQMLHENVTDAKIKQHKVKEDFIHFLFVLMSVSARVVGYYRQKRQQRGPPGK